MRQKKHTSQSVKPPKFKKGVFMISDKPRRCCVPGSLGTEAFHNHLKQIRATKLQVNVFGVRLDEVMAATPFHSSLHFTLFSSSFTVSSLQPRERLMTLQHCVCVQGCTTNSLFDTWPTGSVLPAPPRKVHLGCECYRAAVADFSAHFIAPLRLLLPLTHRFSLAN